MVTGRIVLHNGLERAHLDSVIAKNRWVHRRESEIDPAENDRVAITSSSCHVRLIQLRERRPENVHECIGEVIVPARAMRVCDVEACLIGHGDIEIPGNECGGGVVLHNQPLDGLILGKSSL